MRRMHCDVHHASLSKSTRHTIACSRDDPCLAWSLPGQKRLSDSHKCRSAFPSFASAHQHASILQSKLQTSRWTSVGRNNTHIDAGTATFGTMDVLGNVAHKVRVPQHSAKGCGIEFSGVLTRQAMSGQHVGIVEVPQSRYSVFRIRT